MVLARVLRQQENLWDSEPQKASGVTCALERLNNQWNIASSCCVKDVYDKASTMIDLMDPVQGL